MKPDKPILEYITLCVVILIAIAVFFQLKNQEINFCRSAFAYLVKGSLAAEKFIDWENLKALDVDAGATYNRLPDEKEKAGYRKVFIKGFSTGFSRVKGQLKSFTNWRIYDKVNREVVVACDYLGYNKTLLFTVSKLGRVKLVSLEWENAK